MELVLSVGGKVLDRITLNPGKAKTPDYIQAQKRLLLFKNKLSVVALKEDPDFYLEAASKVDARR